MKKIITITLLSVAVTSLGAGSALARSAAVKAGEKTIKGAVEATEGAVRGGTKVPKAPAVKNAKPTVRGSMYNPAGTGSNSKTSEQSTAVKPETRSATANQKARKGMQNMRSQFYQVVEARAAKGEISVQDAEMAKLAYDKGIFVNAKCMELEATPTLNAIASAGATIDVMSRLGVTNVNVATQAELKQLTGEGWVTGLGEALGNKEQARVNTEKLSQCGLNPKMSQAAARL